MVQTGSHQAAMRGSANYRLLGTTHSARVFLRRNLAAVSGAPAAFFKLHKDGVARAVDDFASHESGMYPIEDILSERVSEGRTQYLVSWAGDWPTDQKQTWVEAGDCEPYDIANFKVDKQIEASRLNDVAHGIPADGQGAVEGRESVSHRTRSRVSRLSSTSSIQKPRFGLGKRSVVRPSQTYMGGIKAGWRRNKEEEDAEYEEISDGEQAYWASRSAFGR